MPIGLKSIEALGPDGEPAIAVRLLYPAQSGHQTLNFGPYQIEAAPDAPFAATEAGLVVISHGMGGSGLSHRGLAASLAEAGYVTALFDHPGDNRSDRQLSGKVGSLEARPRHVTQVIDAIFADPQIGPCLRPEVGMVGHSLGGYTALAIAGGRPTAFAWETPEGEARDLSITPDPRVRALMLLAPATVWFNKPGALADISAPVLMLTAEHDTFAPAFHGELVRSGLASAVESQEIAGAGHFSFQSPFPEAMVSADFPPSQDPPGFDRAAFAAVMNAEAEAFFRRSF